MNEFQSKKWGTRPPVEKIEGRRPPHPRPTIRVRDSSVRIDSEVKLKRSRLELGLGRMRAMNYISNDFIVSSSSRFRFSRTDKQTDRQTHRRHWTSTAADVGNEPNSSHF